MSTTCSVPTVPTCGRPARGLGWCDKHYQAARKHNGDPLAVRPSTPRGEQLAYYLANVGIRTPDCKIWPYSLAQGGYGRVTIDGKVRRVHVLACQERWGDPPVPGLDALHGPCNNHACWNGDHLSWGTHAENMAHRQRDNTLPRGARHGRSKLTEADVIEIRRRFTEGNVTRTALAAEFNVTRSMVGLIVARKNWTHLS